MPIPFKLLFLIFSSDCLQFNAFVSRGNFCLCHLVNMGSHGVKNYCILYWEWSSIQIFTHFLQEPRGSPCAQVRGSWWDPFQAVTYRWLVLRWRSNFLCNTRGIYPQNRLHCRTLKQIPDCLGDVHVTCTEMTYGLGTVWWYVNYLKPRQRNIEILWGNVAVIWRNASCRTGVM